VPLQRLPTVWAPNQDYERWTREEPTGNIVAGGTIANISAMMIARSAVFDYLLCWDGAVQSLGPSLAWECVREIWDYKRMVVLTSLQTHYSIDKAALQAGLAPCNVIKVPGSQDPWRLDGPAVEQMFIDAPSNTDPHKLMDGDLVIAVVLIAGKTETGYVDAIGDIAQLLNSKAAPTMGRSPSALPTLSEVAERMYLDGPLHSSPGPTKPARETLKTLIGLRAPELSFTDEFERRRESYVDKQGNVTSHLNELRDRCNSGASEICEARHNRLFLHVDAAHGAGYLTVPALRNGAFRGIEHADTITIDGHKSLYCYYPCGGLLIRAKRWARTLAIGSSEYISENANYEAYDEGVAFFRELAAKQGVEWDKLIPPKLTIDFRQRNSLIALQKLIGRSIAEHSELTHQPFNQYLEGSRGPQGIMQLYFGLATLGMRGYRSILEWTYLLRERCEEAISLGLVDVRLVNDRPFLTTVEGDPLPVEREKETHALPLKSTAIGRSNPTPMEEIPRPLPVGFLAQEGVMPIAGGRFLRLSSGSCNQLLITYVPARECQLIAAASADYWRTIKRDRKRIVETMRFLWRVNEYLWNEHLYANPTFTYYLGHTPLKLVLPTKVSAGKTTPQESLAKLLQSWNSWARRSDTQRAGFFDALTEEVAEQHERSEAKRKSFFSPPTSSGEEERPLGETIPSGNAADQSANSIHESEMKFFCHKVITMHPYTDESLLGDMLRRVAFWGEQSMTDVSVADSAVEIIGKQSKTLEPRTGGAQGRN
jgi:glutamate/tyrosine decarboxylase-like PLP-dependent enzyme